jgi:hypothetical protein
MLFSISGPLSSRETDIGQRVDIGRGMITVLNWKKACINLFITYFNIELKRTKLTSHTDTKLIWIWVIDVGWGMITFLLWKKSFIDLFIKRLNIVLSEFCPDICPWVDITVALPVFTYGKNWRYYLLICDKYLLQTHIIYVQINSVLYTCHLRHEIHCIHIGININLYWLSTISSQRSGRHTT